MTIYAITLTNPGAEAGSMAGWTTSVGTVESAATDIQGLGAPLSGTKLFRPNSGSGPSQFYQDYVIDAGYLSAVDADNAAVVVSNWIKCISNFDRGALWIKTYDAMMNLLDSDSSGNLQTNGAWVNPSIPHHLPPLTRTVRIGADFIHEAGSHINVIMDDFAMTLSDDAIADYPIKVTQHSLLAAVGRHAEVRVTVNLFEMVVGRPGPVRITTHTLIAATAATRIIIPVFGDSESSTFDYEAELILDAAPIVEINPYRPDVPTEFFGIGEDGIFYDFQRQVQETLRQQHNLTQVGDTTYHWFVLTKVTEDRKWTLGSLGRFYHEDYGIIIGRYVQFDKMIDSNWLGAPCGRLKTTERTEWVVTNDILKSNPDWVMGFSANFDHIEDKQYGWIIVDGTNLYSIRLDQESFPIRDESIVWSSTAKSKTGIAGRSFGRVVVPSESQIDLPPGSSYIRIEGFTDNYYIDLLTGNLSGTLDQFQAQLTNHENRLDILEAQTSTDALSAQIAVLSARLQAETQARITNDDSLRLLIDAVPTFNDLTILETSLHSYIDSKDDALGIRINAAQARADQAYELASALDLTSTLSQLGIHTLQIADLYNQIEVLQAEVDAIELVAAKIYLPVVTGEVPPVFVYLDDGRLVYAEVSE